MKISSNKQMDGGKFSFGQLKRNIFSNNSLGNVIKNTKKSENYLINTYEEYDDKTKKYNKAYDDHMKNLKTLDDYINFKGMESLFKNIIMKDIFKTGHIDKSNPLLFRNYLIESDVPPSTFRKEHILQQVRYILNKYFPKREHLLIRYMDVDVGKTAFNLNTITSDNGNQSRKIDHNNYIISKSETKKALSDILSKTKKNLKRESILVEYNNSSTKSSASSSKSKDKKITNNNLNNDNIIRDNKKSRKKASRQNSKKTLKNINQMINLDLNSHKSKKYNSNLPEIKTNTEPSKKEKLSIYWTKSERKAAKDAAKPKPLPIPTFEPGLSYQPVDLGLIQEQAQNLLTGHVTPITQPLTEPYAQPAIQQDAESLRCDTYSGDYETCRSQNCLFSRGKCIKKEPRPQLFGTAPPPQEQNQFGQQLL